MTAVTRIIGIGNPLMGDDGLGISAIQLLQREALPETIELIDGGCGGLKLLPLFSGCQQLVIIDAADFGAEPGHIKTLGNSDLQRIPTPVTRQNGHQFGLAEILLAAQQLQQLPPLLLHLMQIKACRPNTPLATEIKKALPVLIRKITSPELNNQA